MSPENENLFIKWQSTLLYLKWLQGPNKEYSTHSIEGKIEELEDCIQDLKGAKPTTMKERLKELAVQWKATAKYHFNRSQLCGDSIQSANFFATKEALEICAMELEEIIIEDSKMEPMGVINVSDNSDAFRAWLKEKGLEDWHGNAGFTSVLIKQKDAFSLGMEWGVYKHLNQPKK